VKTKKGQNNKRIARFPESRKGTEESFFKKLYIPRAKSFGIFMGFVLIAAVAAFIFYMAAQYKEYTGYRVINTAEVKISAGSNVIRFGESLLVYGNDGAKCVDSSGEVIWNVAYEFQKPMLDICGDVVGIANYNGTKIYMMSEKEVLGEINTGMPVRNFRVSAQGLAIAVLDDSTTAPIYIYDTEGNKKAFFSTSMKNSGYPLALSISENGYLVGVSYLYVDAGSYKSNVAFYNFGEVGQNVTDNLVSGYTYSNAVVPQIQFIGNDKAIAVADNRLIFYEGGEKPTNKDNVILQEEIISTFYSDKYVALVFEGTEEDGRYRIDIYNGKGICQDSFFYDEDYKEMFFAEDYLVIYSEERCLVHRVGGIDKFNGAFESPIVAMMPTGSANRYVIVSGEKVETIRFE